MQNLMPQLNLADQMIQQQLKASQSSGRSGKKDGREDDFRNLLENSSKGSGLKEDETVSRPDLPEEATVVGPQDNTTKGGDTVDEGVLQDVGMQMFQFLMMGGGQLENVQVDAGLTGNLVQPQPETEAVVEITPLQGSSLPTDPTADLPEIADLGEENGVVIPVQASPEKQAKPEPVEDLGVEEKSLAADVKVGNAVQDQAEGSPKGRDAEANGSRQKEKMPERQIRTETASKPQAGSKTVGDTVQKPPNTSEGMEVHEDGPSGVQAYVPESVLQQGPFQDWIQGTTGTVPIVHVQAAGPQELMDQLMDQLRAKTSLGDQEFEVQLHPENLGKLAIKVAYTAEKVSISIVCSNERTMELLSSGAKNIAQIMEENLGAPTTVMVDQEESNYLEQYNEQQNSRQQQQEQEKKQEKAPEDEHQDFLQQLRLGLI